MDCMRSTAWASNDSCSICSGVLVTGRPEVTALEFRKPVPRGVVVSRGGIVAEDETSCLDGRKTRRGLGFMEVGKAACRVANLSSKRECVAVKIYFHLSCDAIPLGATKPSVRSLPSAKGLVLTVAADALVRGIPPKV